MLSALLNQIGKECRETRLWAAYGNARTLLDKECFSGRFYAFVDNEDCYLQNGEGGKFVFSYWEGFSQKLKLEYPLNEFVKNPGGIVAQIRLKILFS
jgi:hypothetical protein